MSDDLNTFGAFDSIRQNIPISADSLNQKEALSLLNGPESFTVGKCASLTLDLHVHVHFLIPSQR